MDTIDKASEHRGQASYLCTTRRKQSRDTRSTPLWQWWRPSTGKKEAQQYRYAKRLCSQSEILHFDPIFISQSPLIEIFKGWYDNNYIFSTLHEEASENHVEFQLHLSKQGTALNKQVQKNQAWSVALTRVILLLLLRWSLIGNAWIWI